MMTATIPASRSHLGHNVVIGAPIGAEDHLAPMYRSFVQFADEVNSGECDSMLDWSYVVTYSDGTARRYTFDGAEVVRSAAYIPGDVSELREAFVAYAEEMHGAAADNDENGEVVADSLGYTPSERRAINRRDTARRRIAVAMGYKGIKDWKAEGSPVDWDTVRAACKTAKSFNAIVREAEVPTHGGTINRQTASIIRPTRLPGQYQGHSHNN